MRLILSIIGSIIDIAILPFKSFNPLFGFSFIAILSGLLAVVIFKYISNQNELKRIMSQIKLYFLEIFIYRDNLSQILFSQKKILKNNFAYLKYALIAALPIMCAVLLILSQVNLIYSIQPINTDEIFTIGVKLEPNTNQNPDDIKLSLPDDLELITEFGFFLKETNEIEWQLKAKNPGLYTIVIKMGEGVKYNKQIIIGASQKKYSPHLGKNGFFETIFNPIEPLIPKESTIQAIDIKYKPLYFKIIFNMHWLIAFLIIAIGSGLIFRKILKVS